ncbi:esterase/lipase family protein [Rhodococcus koreensis]|uniref:Triacylglycerol lipase n=1 Tax=Rhodococcus koreensis TaxID=99653 RepID=A0A1H4TUY0_9NOCA|nr:alpha/beta fold hydrolase [Rhodococcus koreensis]SEC60296.1 triacylglycerol lipase [Rhodococcus koreensis]
MRRCVSVSGILFLAFVMWAGVASAAPAYPVPDSFLAGVPLELGNPDGSAPGSNDWSCRPSDAHPEPVVLVHGTGGARQTNWAVYAPLLANEGYCVYSLTYGNFPDLPWPLDAIGGMTPIDTGTAQIAAFVDQVLASTGAAKVDLVGHSQGTVQANNYVKFFGGADKVAKIVSLAPPWQGTYGNDQISAGRFLRSLGIDDAVAAGFPVCQACPEMLQGSKFIDRMRAGGVYVPGIEYTNIVTRYDELVVPYTSGLEPGPHTINIVVQDGCQQDYSDHVAVAGSARAAGFVLNALDRDNPRVVPCSFVAPVAG